MKKITVVIHTRNEQDVLRESVESAKLLTTDVIAIDMQSTDRTSEIAKSLGAIVHSISPQPYVELVRAMGIEKATGPWVFILDADERLTPELVAEVKEILEDTHGHTFFKVPRKNLFGGGRWLRHGGWWPDYQIRLINKKAFKDWPQQIHSTPVIDGHQGILQYPLTHLAHGNIEKMVEKTLVFENIESDLLWHAQKSVSILTFFRKFLGELWRRLIAKAGFLDGTIGIIEGVYQAFSRTITYLMLYEKQHHSTGPRSQANKKSRSL